MLYANKLDAYVTSGIRFDPVPYAIEIFPAPIPKELDGTPIETGADLLLTSANFGYSELLIPDGESLTGHTNGDDIEISRFEFLAWQLVRSPPETLYHLACKVEVSLHDILDFDVEYGKDNSYDPESWLNPYSATEEDLAKGLVLIERLLAEHPEVLLERLIHGILDEDTGVLAWLETEISDNLAEIRDLYSEWSVPIMVVSQGGFTAYIETGCGDNLMREDFWLRTMYVRNYDEGDI